MLRVDIVRPNVSNFVKSLRDMGYTFEIAVADILDNSISAGAKKILIQADKDPHIILSLMDDGEGMNEAELIEAMRLGSKDPELERLKHDLGRFGMGLKTASFSQCKKVTVISKKNGVITSKQWDLDFVEKEDEWQLITPTLEMIKELPLFEELSRVKNGTIVVWESIDAFQSDAFTETIYNLREHLSLVFHRFLEGDIKGKKIAVSINGNPLLPLNPFNEKNPATQWLPEQKIKMNNSFINVQPVILPHHSKTSRQEYEKYATADGYTKSQGFYLYREGRLLIHGTWWGLHKVSDTHRLVRIKIDATNDQDDLWNIDVKKSMAAPDKVIKTELKKVLDQVLERGSRPFTGRGRKIEDKTTTHFWDVAHNEEEINFLINKQHPLLRQLLRTMDETQLELVTAYFKALEAYLPLTSIQSHMLTTPHKVKQESRFTEEEIIVLAKKLRELDLDDDYINEFLKTELFKNHKELLVDGK